MPDDVEGIDVASEDIEAAQAVLLELQNATAKATEQLNERRANALAEERGLVDVNFTQKPENGAAEASRTVRVAMFFGYNGSGYHVRLQRHTHLCAIAACSVFTSKHAYCPTSSAVCRFVYPPLLRPDSLCPCDAQRGPCPCSALPKSLPVYNRI